MKLVVFTSKPVFNYSLLNWKKFIKNLPCLFIRIHSTLKLIYFLVNYSDNNVTYFFKKNNHIQLNKAIIKTKKNLLFFFVFRNLLFFFILRRKCFNFVNFNNLSFFKGNLNVFTKNIFLFIMNYLYNRSTNFFTVFFLKFFSYLRFFHRKVKKLPSLFVFFQKIHTSVQTHSAKSNKHVFSMIYWTMLSQNFFLKKVRKNKRQKIRLKSILLNFYFNSMFILFNNNNKIINVCVVWTITSIWSVKIYTKFLIFKKNIILLNKKTTSFRKIGCLDKTLLIKCVLTIKYFLNYFVIQWLYRDLFFIFFYLYICVYKRVMTYELGFFHFYGKLIRVPSLKYRRYDIISYDVRRRSRGIIPKRYFFNFKKKLLQSNDSCFFLKRQFKSLFSKNFSLDLFFIFYLVAYPLFFNQFNNFFNVFLKFFSISIYNVNYLQYYLYYNNLLPVFLLPNNIIKFFKKKQEIIMDEELSLFFRHHLGGFFEFFTKKKIFIKIVTRLKIKQNILNILQHLSQVHWGFQKSVGRGFFLEEMLFVLWQAFYQKDLNFLVEWFQRTMQKIESTKHKTFIKNFKFLLLKYDFFFKQTTKILGFRFEIRGKIGVTGNAKKKHTIFSFGASSFSKKNHRLDLKQGLVYTETGVLGITFIITY